ncbi:hypothetical protein [Helicobacter pylori]|nr:hypothetical protein [Helicobacter pylori]
MGFWLLRLIVLDFISWWNSFSQGDSGHFEITFSLNTHKIALQEISLD